MALVTASALSGCGSVPPLKRITLSPPQTDRVPAKPSDWHVQRVQVPEYLDNYQLQVRQDAHLLTEIDNAKWAIRLPVAITQLLQQTIDEKLVQARNAPYEVRVNIITFEPQPAGRVVLAADWQVRNSRTDEPVARDTTLITEPLADRAQTNPEAVGQAMSDAVRELAMQILAQAG